ncbi:MAG: tRNA lysidine(34) synthetase TilS [Thermotogaceae bacterium]|nr:tRNA lysidine(34) synthetase TilS [Thermotogaceae bacterium]
MVLLHVMLEVLAERRGNFCVAHLNHGIRAASRSEYAGVRQLCKGEGVRFFGSEVDIPILHKTVYRGKSLEDAARIERRRFLKRAAEAWGANFIVTAHQRDDLLETFMMRLMRGSGLSGYDCLKAIEPPFLRPLLPFWKADLIRYAGNCRIAYYEDHTNQDNQYLRNRIRNELIPFLSSRFGKNLPHVLVRDQEQLSSASQMMEELLEPFVRGAVFSEKAVCFSWNALKERSDAFLSELFVRSCKRWRGHTYGIESVKMTQAIGRLRLAGSFALPFRHDLWFFREYDRCGFTSEKPERIDYEDRFRRPPAEGSWENPDYPLHFRTHGGRRITLTAERGLKPEAIDYLEGERWTALLDEDKMRFPLILRAPRPGDRFRPLGMREDKKITRFCTDQKISIKDRSELLLLINQKSDIIWCIGIRIADTVKITRDTRRVLRVKCQFEPEKGIEGRERSIPQFFD